MHPTRIAVLASILAAGLIAGCGSSSSHTTSTQAAAATAQSSSGAAGGSTATSTALISTKHAKLGTVLAYGPKHLSVYLFQRDSGPHSTCSGACAGEWPPVIGKPTASGGAIAADLGTTKRADGTLQVTYKGHPLYGFVRDKDGEDTYGQGIDGFGAKWYVLGPSGNTITGSTASSGSGAGSSSSSSSSRYSNGY